MEVTLKGAVISKFGSAEKFAKHVGWSGRKARDIVSGRQEPSAQDMRVVAEAIGITSPMDFCAIFFKDEYAKWTTGREKQ